VDVDISVSGALDDSAEIRSLFRWLRDDDLPGAAVRWAPAAPGPGEMGGVSDVLVVALGSGGSVGAVLAGSLSVWIRHRTSDVKITLRGKGGTVELDGKRIKDPVEVVEALRKAVGE
jgi:hypothetical protein